MSVHFSNNPNQVVEVECSHQPRNRVPLERMTSREERVQGFKYLKVFRKLDTDHDGYLSVSELKKLITSHSEQIKDLPAGVSDYCLHKVFDENGDGQLDFEEFYNLARKNEWLVRKWCVKYCEYIIPPRKCVKVPQPRYIAPMAASAAFDQVDHVAAYSFAPTYDTIDGEGDYEDEMKFWPPKLTMVTFSIIEVIFFVIDIIYMQDYNSDLHQVGTQLTGPMAKLFIYNPRKRYEAWRFVTYMFVHVGMMHLMMNLIIQICLGIFLEVVHCWWRVALIYLAGVAAGSMGTSIANPSTYLAGASGGVYALITAHVASIILNWQEMRSGFVQLFAFLIYIGIDVAMSIHRHMSDPSDRVGYTAHLCGGIAGLLVGIGVLRNLEKKNYEKILWWLAMTIYFVLMIGGICFHIFNPDHFLSPYSGPSSKASF